SLNYIQIDVFRNTNFFPDKDFGDVNLWDPELWVHPPAPSTYTTRFRFLPWMLLSQLPFRPPYWPKGKSISAPGTTARLKRTRRSHELKGPRTFPDPRFSIPSGREKRPTPFPWRYHRFTSCFNLKIKSSSAGSSQTT